MAKNKALFKEEREKVRKLVERETREMDFLTIQIRELKCKLSTSRMREEDNMLTISELQRTMDEKKVNN